MSAIADLINEILWQYSVYFLGFDLRAEAQGWDRVYPTYSTTHADSPAECMCTQKHAHTHTHHLNPGHAAQHLIEHHCNQRHKFIWFISPHFCSKVNHIWMNPRVSSFSVVKVMVWTSGGLVQILNQIVTRPDVTRVVDCWEALKSTLSHITCNSTSNRAPWWKQISEEVSGP